MSELDKILSKLTDGPGSFVSKLPDIEKQIFKELITSVKSLQIDQSGRVVPNIENLKVISSIKVKLEKVLLSVDYKSAVKDFVKEFSNISNLGAQYFNFNALPNNEMFKAVKDIAIDNTLESLTGSGYTSTVVSKLGDMLVKSVTSGGMYIDLVEGLRSDLLTTDKSSGLLSRYAKTYATDALSQFSGQQMKLVSDGLRSQWYRYIGSNKETTREFCRLLTEKDFIHESELPKILKGHIDGQNCEINNKTRLPLGMMENTTVNNLIINRGGHNCQHSLIPVSEISVPQYLKDKFANKGL